MNHSQISRTDFLRPAASAGRLVSLDALRGFDMFWIIGGATALRGLAKATDSPIGDCLITQLRHVSWEGLHFCDVIWPLFMFIVGAAIPFSIASRRSRGHATAALYRHAVLRAVILFCLGMIAQGNLLKFDLDEFRPFYSVLHGIAAGYLIATIVVLNLPPAGQLGVTAAFLLVYSLLMMLVPVPGVGAGVLTAEGNLAGHIDRVLTRGLHFGTNTWFLSYMGFASSVLLGALAGQWLRSSRPAPDKVLGLLAGGGAAIALGLLWSLWVPIIKLLWTSSFVLVAGGISCLLMALFYFVIDVLQWRKWAFVFVVIGRNSIAVYMATSLFDFREIGNVFVGDLLGRLGPWSSFLESLTALTIVWLILYWMYRTKSFVKI